MSPRVAALGNYLTICERAREAGCALELDPLAGVAHQWLVSVWATGSERECVAQGSGHTIDRAAAAALADWREVEAA